MEEIRRQTVEGLRPVHTFREASARYLETKLEYDSARALAYHIEILDPWIGDLPLDKVHDDSLAPFIEHRLKTVKPATVKRHLEVVRAITRLAASSWRDPLSEKTWIAAAPKITMPSSRDMRATSDVPYPLNIDEVTTLFRELDALSPTQALVCRFMLHTGLRDSEARNLKWSYEDNYTDLDRPVFFIPGSAHKNDMDRLVVLSDKALAIVEHQRGKSDTWVFPAPSGKPFYNLNTNQWQKAWRAAGLPTDGFVCGPHNLRHTLGHRLRRAEAPDYIIGVFLGHASTDITEHYSAADITTMLKFANAADTVMESAIFRRRRKHQ
jgi:integrase